VASLAGIEPAVPDKITSAWIRNPSDERAVANGCRLDAERAAYVIWWIERYCRLYEGEQAGEPLLLRGCHKCGDYGLSAPMASWEDARKSALDRMRRYGKCVERGHDLDWQYECTVRLFGWARYAEKWQREVRRFRQASIWVPKKNKKSPTLAAWALYAECGDGEPGQKVYLAAKDGNQAREIAGRHVIEMVRQSPELDLDCSISENAGEVRHKRTKSTLRPLSSSNARTQQAKEGLNGSIFVDECHVVDREFIGRLSRAGISRSEPLQVEVSTAGSDPAGYGKERFELAERTIRGDYQANECEHIFAAIYAAPQDLSDADLAADPLKYGRLANPAMGHTVTAEEFLQDYGQSKGSLTELARFKMYRLDIWQGAATPWLDMGAWAKCRRDYTEADLVGRPCAGALDLGKTRDTCALVLVFWWHEDDTFRQWPYFWLPRARAELLRDKVPYLKWAAEGQLKLTGGDIADYGVIRSDIVALKERFALRKLVYDDCYAEQLIQALVEQDRVFSTDEVASFPQTIKEFAGPTDEYEGLILSGRLHHPGNDLLTWQAGNAKVKTDTNQNRRPVKQRHGSLLTIDGVVAGIMAVSQGEPLKRAASVYDERGILDL
jgi:phage terminase large subunit-like protein